MKVIHLIIYPIILSIVFFTVARISPPHIIFNNQADGFAYYLPLRSLLYKLNVNFAEENEAYENTYGVIPYAWREKTNTGNYVYPYSIGPSLLWSPFIFPFQINKSNTSILQASALSDQQTALIAKASQTYSFVLNGYSPRDLLILVLVSQLYGVTAIILAYFFIKKFFPGKNLLLVFSVIISGLGTPFLYYLRYQPLMSHTFSAFATSFFLFLWSFHFSKQKLFRFFYIGLSLGLVSLIRWQDIIFLVFPLTELMLLFFHDKFKNILHKLTLIGALISGLFLAFTPQIIFWKFLYGEYLIIPQGSSFFTFNDLHIIDFLFSFRHGLFTWSPLIAFSFLGILLMLVKSFIHPIRDAKYRVLTIGSLVLYFLSIYINSSIIDWHGSDSFGARRIVSLFPVYSIGLFFLFLSIKNYARILLYSLISILVIYNYIFTFLFYKGAFDHYKEVTPIEVINKIQELYL